MARRTAGSRRPPGVEPLGSILRRVVDRRGRLRGCSGEELALAWRRAAGEELSRHTAVRGLRRGVLHVAVDSGVLLQQLAGFQRESLRQRLQEQFVRAYISDIQFSLSPGGAPAD